jgi:hypothetical protein
MSIVEEGCETSEEAEDMLQSAHDGSETSLLVRKLEIANKRIMVGYSASTASCLQVPHERGTTALVLGTAFA